jgi:hypothetical protein
MVERNGILPNTSRASSKHIGFFNINPEHHFSHSSSIRHHTHNRSMAGEFDQFLMPAEQHAHLLSSTTFAEISRLNLGESGALWRRSLARRGLRPTACRMRGHAFVAAEGRRVSRWVFAGRNFHSQREEDRMLTYMYFIRQSALSDPPSPKQTSSNTRVISPCRIPCKTSTTVAR